MSGPMPWPTWAWSRCWRRGVNVSASGDLGAGAPPSTLYSKPSSSHTGTLSPAATLPWSCASTMRQLACTMECQQARALRPGGAHGQLPISPRADLGPQVFGAPRLFANAVAAPGRNQQRGSGGGPHQALQRRTHQGQKADHGRHRVARQAKKPSRFAILRAVSAFWYCEIAVFVRNFFMNFANSKRPPWAQRQAPKCHFTQFLHQSLGVVGGAHADTTAGDDGIGHFRCL